MNNIIHTPVLLDELVNAVDVEGYKIFVDCTFGGGGHTFSLLNKKKDNDTLVIGIDRDLNTLNRAYSHYSDLIQNNRLILIHSNFSGLGSVLRGMNLHGKVDAVFADLGVSNMQIDDPDRGFSFQEDGPLDMRMDTSKGTPTAADLLKEIPLNELITIFRNYGEEPKAVLIAKALIRQRDLKPITRTNELAEFVAKFWRGSGKSRKHPATRVFQALRIAVNMELTAIETLLKDGFEALKPNGRMAIITFHSLEDRIIKHGFKKLCGLETEAPQLSKLPFQAQNKPKIANVIFKNPITPSEEEIFSNPRSRSAKLRVVEKV